MLKINEIFGPTIQGEGAAAGRHCLFVRTALCNLECSWCDTDYTWAFTGAKAAKHRNGIVHSREENLKEMTNAEIIEQLQKLWPIHNSQTIIVISGGEPMMQQEGLIGLTSELWLLGNFVHIETAGTLAPKLGLDRYITQYNVSPKLAHSGNVLSKRYKPDAIEYFSNSDKAWFKFVITKLSDLEEVDDLVRAHQIRPHRVMCMPEGNNVDNNIETARMFSMEAIGRGYGISFRSHVLLWPKIDRGI